MFEAIGGLYRFLQAEIIDRQKTLAIQDENQKHFGCPAADAVYRCQRFDHFFIAHAREAAAGDFAAEEMLGEIDQIFALLAGEAAALEVVWIFVIQEFQSVLGGWAFQRKSFFKTSEGGGGEEW